MMTINPDNVNEEIVALIESLASQDYEISIQKGATIITDDNRAVLPYLVTLIDIVANEIATGKAETLVDALTEAWQQTPDAKVRELE